MLYRIPHSVFHMLYRIPQSNILRHILNLNHSFVKSGYAVEVPIRLEFQLHF